MPERITKRELPKTPQTAQKSESGDLPWLRDVAPATRSVRKKTGENFTWSPGLLGKLPHEEPGTYRPVGKKVEE